MKLHFIKRHICFSNYMTKDKLQVIDLKSHNLMQLFIEYLLFGGIHGVRQDRQEG